MSPVTAAQTLLHSACKKRKEMLQKTMNLLLQIIQTSGTTPSQKDGALHMIGTMADILLKKPVYKEQMEKFLVEIVFPEFRYKSRDSGYYIILIYFLFQFSSWSPESQSLLGASLLL